MEIRVTSKEFHLNSIATPILGVTRGKWLVEIPHEVDEELESLLLLFSGSGGVKQRRGKAVWGCIGNTGEGLES